MTTETIFRQCITCSIFLLSEKAAKLHAPICKFNTANTFKRRLLSNLTVTVKFPQPYVKVSKYKQPNHKITVNKQLRGTHRISSNAAIPQPPPSSRHEISHRKCKLAAQEKLKRICKQLSPDPISKTSAVEKRKGGYPNENGKEVREKSIKTSGYLDYKESSCSDRVEVETANQKGFQCPLCNANRKNQHNLRRHFLVHLENSPFPCKFPDCGKKFEEVTKLRAHHRIHESGDKAKLSGYHKQSQSATTTPPAVDPNKKAQIKIENNMQFQLEAIHLVDHIIETESGPVHIKGEYLTPTTENANNSINKIYPDTADKNSNECNMSSTKEQIAAREWILKDPVYIRLLTENPEVEELLMGGDNFCYTEKDFLPQKDKRNGLTKWRDRKNPSKWFYECDICENVVSQSGIAYHKRTHEKKHKIVQEKKFHCPICQIGTKDRFNLRRHFVIHLENNPFVCKFPKCRHRCGNEHYLRTHMLRHNRNNRWRVESSEITESQTSDSKPLGPAGIMKLIMADPVYLRLIEERPEVKQVLEGTRFIHTYPANPKRFSCSNCPATYNRYFNLELHKKKCVGINGSENEKDNSPMEVEASVGGDNIKLMCGECGYQAKSKDELENHWKTASNHKHLMKFKCHYPACGVLSATEKKLEKHIKLVHFTEKKLKCSECQKAFSSRSGLCNHMQTKHSKKDSFKCTVCSKAFRTPSVLATHKRKHWKESKARSKCEICGDEFITKHTLLRHIRTVHTKTLKFNRKGRKESEPRESPQLSNEMLQEENTNDDVRLEDQGAGPSILGF